MDDSADIPDLPNDDLTLPLASDDTETDDDRMAISQPPVRIYTPPPHIAARFYRSAAQARRKSSAASSRRNSISSTHSRSSHGFGLTTAPGGGAPQSKHVAQHLRRASILADRKARLADRAAHAEQVRLRAALAKAAVRDISLSEERAQAAAQAREKNLAEIAASCAEEVKRAKAVAESMKEKREANLQRLRQQIQDRLDEAERRREELRRTSAAGRTRTRGHSVATGRKQVEVLPEVAEGKENASQVDGSPSGPSSATDADHQSDTDTDTSTPALTPDEAAHKILRWWRKNHRRRAIADFQQLGLAMDGVRGTSFEDVVELLGQDKVLLATGKVLRLCGIQEGKTSSVKEIVAIRAFLSAFLILGHPTQVLSNKNGAVDAAAKGGRGSLSTGGRGSSRQSTNAGDVGGNGHGNGGGGGGDGGGSRDKSQLAAGTNNRNDQEQVRTLPTTTVPLSTPIGKDDLANPQLQDLVGKAKDLLICFETILSRLTYANDYTPPSALASELVEAYDGFYDAFIAWKARDASALVDVMIMQFVELDAIWQTVKDSTDASVSDTYRQSIQQNQLLLMVRIKKLAGKEEGKKKIFEAVRKARKAKEEANRQAAAASSEMKPREADHTTIETAMGDLTGEGSSSSHDGGLSSSALSKAAAAAAAIESPAGAASSRATGAASSDAAIAGMLPLHGDASSGARAEAKLRGLRSTSTAERYSSSPLPENRVVVHELVINRKYRVSATQFKQQQASWMEPIFHRMRKTMATNNREEQEEHFYYLLAIAECIRYKLERLTVPGKTMHQFIGELLDTEVARRQFVMGSFSYERFFASIGQLLPKLCAPIRDDEVKELVGTTLHQGDYVDRLQALLSFVDVMLTDHVNFMISVAAPRLLLSATEYETRRFAELVSEQHLEALPAATAAWRSARTKILTETARRDPEGIHHPKSRPTPDQFYMQMLVDVFSQLSPIPRSEMPEMLLLDHARAHKWGAATRRIVTAGAVLLQCKNLLKRDVRLPWKTEAHRVLAVLEKAEKDAATSSSSSSSNSSSSKHQQGLAAAVDATDAAAAAAAARLHDTLGSGTVLDGVMAALESGRSMPPATRAQLRTYVQRTLAASAEVAMARAGPPTNEGDAVPQEPVLRLLLHRLRGYLVARLAAASSAEKVRQTNTAGERLASLGLAEFAERVREMVEEVARVGAVDRETHGTFWETVSSAAEAADAAEATASA
ncbi:IQ calmodulin-binding motif domain containing protein [Niveomyces insectorum RCEF 264]|uniref:IQ calmodulin-binding motif domain containing protein n=1 Tax=Niveomyces insectorum RCEF 264 TaxID=1081102 RepID=A0A167Q9S8_9HYPO|nr:IQ calmodulin-binding motif domain containing protein [Niveomyces insectorum RCEF 264]